MADINYVEEMELRSTALVHNRAVRTLNKKIRKKLELVQQDADAKIAVLFDTSSAAQEAIFQIWSNLGLSCEPDDYTSIVASVSKCSV